MYLSPSFTDRTGKRLRLRRRSPRVRVRSRLALAGLLLWSRLILLLGKAHAGQGQRENENARVNTRFINLSPLNFNYWRSVPDRPHMSCQSKHVVFSDG